MAGQRYQPSAEEEFKKLIKKFKAQGLPIVYLVLGVVILATGISSFYTVDPEQQAVVLRLGRYYDTKGPGLHFKLPFGVDDAIKVPTGRRWVEEFGFRSRRGGGGNRFSRAPADLSVESLMLTGDLNVADVQWTVQYEISDPKKYLFNTSNPVNNLRDISQAVMRSVVGDKLVTEVLTVGRNRIEAEAMERMQVRVDGYDMGISIKVVNLQDVNPPEAVKPSFNEVNAAKQEQEKYINEAEREYNRVIPEAKGEAQRKVRDAQGLAEATVKEAQGDAERFNLIVREYRKAPLVTSKRLYLDMLGKVIENTESITVVDSQLKGLLPVYSPGKIPTIEDKK